MPPDGFTSITVRTEYYNKIRLDYERNKVSLQLVGINTFAQYIESLSETRKITDLDDLKELLSIQTQVLITMFDYMLGGDKETCDTNHLRAKQHMFEFLTKFHNQ